MAFSKDVRSDKDRESDGPSEQKSGGPKFQPEPNKAARMRAAYRLGAGREKTAQFVHKVTQATGRIREGEYNMHKVDFAVKGFELVEDFK